MKNLAFVFPGQGSQKVGMLHDVALAHPGVEELFKQASAVLDYDLWEIVIHGPEAKLNQTIYTQPAMLVADLALWHIWQELSDIKPSYVAGHSLGEYAALVVAGVLEFATAVRMVAKRAQFMQEAVPEGAGAMAAIIGMPIEQIDEICRHVSMDGVVSAANLNGPGQVVIAGTLTAVTHAMELARSAGARKVVQLPMSVPSHCALMQPAADRLLIEFEQVAFHRPKMAVINNADVKVFTEPAEIKSALIRQLVMPVRWVETIEFMAANGVQVVAECGPGKVLTGLNKRIVSTLETVGLNNAAEMQQLIEDISK